MKKKKILWVTNSFRYSAIELLVKSFIENELISDNYQIISLRFDDKKLIPAYDLIDDLKKYNVEFEVVNYKTFFGLPRIKVLIDTFICLKKLNQI